jgi:hypothetical protein
MRKLSLKTRRIFGAVLSIIVFPCLANYYLHLGWFGSYGADAASLSVGLCFIYLTFIGPTVPEMEKHRAELDERIYGPMKNVQVIDGADNCTYPVYAMTLEEFAHVFPLEGQDIEFIEDVVSRLGEDKSAALMNPVWNRLVTKNEVIGIHGTLFYGLSSRKKYYPTKKDEEMVVAL